jgi:hypothetical protein
MTIARAQLVVTSLTAGTTASHAACAARSGRGKEITIAREWLENRLQELAEIFTDNVGAEHSVLAPRTLRNSAN